MLNPRQLASLRRTKDGRRNRLVRAIALAGTTQVKLADAIGSQQSRISAIAGGRYGADGLPVETARKLAEFFGCSIEDLFPSQESAMAS